MTHRRVSANDRAEELIQHQAGIEMPAGGTWTIVPGQVMPTERRGIVRTDRTRFRIEHGALCVPGESRVVTLGLGLVAPEVEADVPRSIGFEGRLTSADRAGRWRFRGILTLDGAGSPFELALAYHGVHARGAAPVAWLELADALLTVGGGRRGRRRQLWLSGDLNARRTTVGDASPDQIEAAATAAADAGAGVALSRVR